MNTACEATRAVVCTPAGLTELVRGDDERLVQRVAPLLREQSVALDLDGVERIDAAGIAALIALYKSAHTAGHEFSVFNAAQRVEEILNLVGLDHILVSHNTVRNPHNGACCAQSAA